VSAPTTGISLTKRTENAENALVNLLKTELDKGNDLGEITAQIILAIDFSYSMSERYRNREVQELVERALALALAGLDDDGEIQVFFFDDRSYKPITVNASNYTTVVDDFVRTHSMGGTDYLPTIRDILKLTTTGTGMLKKGKAMAHPDNPPVFVLFITDGQTGNQDQIRHAIYTSADKSVFWQFLGLGYVPAFLEELDQMQGRFLDNANVADCNDSKALSDEAFYKLVTQEFFPKYLPAARAKGILK